MLASNVVSFVKKMVGSTGSKGAVGGSSVNQSAASSVDNQSSCRSAPPAPDGAAIAHLTTEEISILQKVFEKQEQFEKEAEAASRKQPPQAASGKICSRSNACRICLKNLQDVDTSTYNICHECHQKICEDCSSYSEQNQDKENWLCSICRRKIADEKKNRSKAKSEKSDDVFDRKQNLTSRLSAGSGLGGDLSDSYNSEGSPRMRPKTLDNLAFGSGHCSAPQSPSKSMKLMQGESERRSVDKPTQRSPHPPLRHFHSDSGGNGGRMAQLAIQRLSPEINLKERIRSRHSPSTSDSSLEDAGVTAPWTAEDNNGDADGHNWRRRKSKVKRRSRIQRQRSYNDDLQLIPNETEKEGEKRRKEQLLDVPGQSKIVRHHSWDAAVNSRRYSSESSDVSDVGGGMEQEEDEEGIRIEKSSPVHRKLHRRKRMDSEDDYDATMESSPSPDNMEKHSFLPRMDRRTSSEDSDANKSSRRSSGHGSITSQQTWPIPIVEVHEASVADCHSNGLNMGMGMGGGRTLPKIPDQLLRLTPTASSSSSNSSICTTSPRTRQSKSVDLTPLYHDKTTESLLRRSTLSEFESVKIVIDDVDSNRNADKGGRSRKVVLKRMIDSDGHTGRGFGMRVVGGKAGEDGRLFAYVVWTVPDGSAEMNGIAKGDKILEWDGETLVDRTFEEVCVIMDHSGDEVTVEVEHINEQSVRHSSFDVGQLQTPEHIHRRASEGSNIGNCGVVLDLLALEAAKMDVPQPRRRLPKPPEITSSDINCGEIQLVMWYEEDDPPASPVFTVTITEAQELPIRPDGFTPPEVYAKIRLLPQKFNSSFRTPVAEMSVNPSWNESFTYTGISTDDISHKVLVVSLWDMMGPNAKRSLGELILPLRKSKMDGRAEWYRLRDRRSLVSSSSTKSLLVPGGGSEAPDLQRKRNDFVQTRSISDDIDDELALELISHIVKSTSVDANLLRPDASWNRDRRRSSSGSEKSEASTHSCPPLLSSRRNYFTPDGHIGSSDPEPPGIPTTKPPSAGSQWKTRSFKLPRQESLQQIKNRSSSKVSTDERLESVNTRLSRSFSLRADRRCVSMVNVSTVPLCPPPCPLPSPSLTLSSSSILNLQSPGQSPASHRAKDYLTPPVRGRWSSSSSLEGSDDENDTQPATHRVLDHTEVSLKLGPAQVWPKNFTGLPGLSMSLDFRICTHSSSSREFLGSSVREIKLGLIISKGFLEIEVICARGLGHSTITGQTPDTYVKTYLKDGDRHIHKKKTRVVRHTLDPFYKQTLRYPASEVTGRILLVMVWERQKGFDPNHGVGVAHIDPDQLELNKLLIGWYRLFPMGKMVNESESNESN